MRMFEYFGIFYVITMVLYQFALVSSLSHPRAILVWTVMWDKHVYANQAMSYRVTTNFSYIEFWYGTAVLISPVRDWTVTNLGSFVTNSRFYNHSSIKLAFSFVASAFVSSIRLEVTLDKRLPYLSLFLCCSFVLTHYFYCWVVIHLWH